MSRIVVALVASLLLVAPSASHAAGKAAKKTHLGDKVDSLVNLRTNTVPNNNTGGHQFLYDRQAGSPFSVPEGMSFVVTDVFVHLSSFSANNFYLVVVNFDDQGKRTFISSFSGQTMQHHPLSGGFVVPGGHTPTARNTTSSDGNVEVQLLGYFVKGSGPAAGEVLFD